jgi:hypothetical protein
VLRRLLREPLVHFLVLGTALFVLYDALSGAKGGSERRIVVNDATVAAIVRQHQAAWKRPPTPAELRGLVDAHVRDEVLYREGVALGLDRDDAVIRRRVQQKLGVVAEESMARSVPTEAELQDYLDKHAGRYVRPAVVGFEQVMFDPLKRRTSLRADLDNALARLTEGASPEAMGDSSMLPASIGTIPADLLAREYGDGFAAALMALPIGSWSGPIASGYGAHLVRVNHRTPGRTATLAEARAAVAGDWEGDRRAQASEAFYRNALKKYDVVIDVDLPVASAAVPGG